MSTLGKATIYLLYLFLAICGPNLSPRENSTIEWQSGQQGIVLQLFPFSLSGVRVCLGTVPGI
jgi:hypothetical protein